MSRFVHILAVVLAAPTVASAEPPRADIGFGIGAVVDMPDAASHKDTRLGAGPSARVPIRIHFTPSVALRFDLDVALVTGVDELTWDRRADGLVYRVTDDDRHRAVLGAAVFDVGVDLTLPVRGRTRPFFGVSGGAGLVAVFHELRGASLALEGDALPDGTDPTRADPYTLQAVPWVAADLGITSALAARVDLWVTAGYGAAFVGPRALRRALPERDARREAFAWNPLRAALGVSFRLGRSPHPDTAQARP